MTTAEERLRKWQAIAEKQRSGVAPVDYVLLREAANEIKHLRDAIHRAGFGVCQTSGDWTIYEVSDLAAADEARTAEVISRNIDLEIENKQLRADIERLNQMIRETGQGQGAIDAYVAQCEELDGLRETLAHLRGYD